jgi:hypothetical protein
MVAFTLNPVNCDITSSLSWLCQANVALMSWVCR